MQSVNYHEWNIRSNKHGSAAVRFGGLTEHIRALRHLTEERRRSYEVESVYVLMTPRVLCTKSHRSRMVVVRGTNAAVSYGRYSSSSSSNDDVIETSEAELATNETVAPTMTRDGWSGCVMW
jgi:hypothetical protein